jgi:hypothetical protein
MKCFDRIDCKPEAVILPSTIVIMENPIAIADYYHGEIHKLRSAAW